MPASSFAVLDAIRRQAGWMLDAAALGRAETPHRVVSDRPPMRLRAYQPARAGGPPVLLIPAPIKRAYVWDLRPEVSVVRRWLERDARVYVLEWRDPEPAHDDLGLADYADALIGAALDAISAETGEAPALLAGHSLGGTFAAIFAALRPERVRGLILIEAPLAFGQAGGSLARAVEVAPHARLVRELAGSPVPGSYLSLLAAAILPGEFVLPRWTAAKTPLHAAVERWTLDELAMPGRLFEEVVEQLYRKDRLARGRLALGGAQIRMDRIRSPILAVANPQSAVVPMASTLDGLARRAQTLRHEGDGVGLSHLGPLVSPQAHARLWPRILGWALGSADQR